MIQLLASLLILAVGPTFYRVARHRPSGLAVVDGFIVVAIAGLVLLSVLPGTVAEGGWPVILFCGLGLLGPTFLEIRHHEKLPQTHMIAMGLALLGLLFHSFVDGAALLPAPGVDNPHLPLAIILHRLPVGLTVWWLLRPMGRGTAIGVLGLMMAATAVGFFFGSKLLIAVDVRAVAWFEAFVAGSLLHVVLHRQTPLPTMGRRRWSEGAGALLGVALLVFLLAGGGHGDEHATAGHNHGLAEHASVFETFLGMALESAGPLLLAYLMAGFFTVLLPAGATLWMGRGPALGQAAKGMLVGLPFPVCSCGVVPLYRAFVRKGIPASAAMAFLIATPELGLDAILLSIPLLGGEMTLIRLAGAAIVALLVGWLVGRVTRTLPGAMPTDSNADFGTDAPLADRLRMSFRTGFGEMVDHTAAWILLGLAVAAVVQPIVMGSWLATVPDAWEVLFFSLLGLPIYVCASGATPLVAVLLIGGVSPGAALAFLLTGPATNFTTLGVLASLHGRGLALLFAGAMIGTSVALGYGVNALFPAAGAATPPIPGPESAALWKWVCLWILGALYAFSLLRLGARKFFVENLSSEAQLTAGAVPSHSHGH